MHILPFKPEYERQVIDLILDIWEKEFGFTGLERPDIHDISNYYQNDKKSNFWVAVEDPAGAGVEGSEVIGTIALKAMSDSEGELKRLAIKKGHRRKGIGKKLLATLLEFAKENNYKKIYAGMVKENVVAINFYKKFGFVESGTLPDFAKQFGETLCMTLEMKYFTASSPSSPLRDRTV